VWCAHLSRRWRPVARSARGKAADTPYLFKYNYLIKNIANGRCQWSHTVSTYYLSTGMYRAVTNQQIQSFPFRLQYYTTIHVIE
jgi:hypothetical protein